MDANPTQQPAAQWVISARTALYLQLTWACGADTATAYGVTDDFGNVVVVA